MKKNLIQLSPSKLSLFNQCPRCFWLQEKHKVTRPRGIFPSLPSGIDRCLKVYFDSYRGKLGGLPPQLVGKIDGSLYPDQAKLDKWRNWRSGLTYINEEIGVKLIGALDDCVVENELFSPLDYKTKGAKPVDDGSQYYQTQVNCYGLMLHSAGYPISGKSYLVYVYPTAVVDQADATFTFPFEVVSYVLACDKSQALSLLQKAVDLIRGALPDPAQGCEQCAFAAGYLRVVVPILTDLPVKKGEEVTVPLEVVIHPAEPVPVLASIETAEKVASEVGIANLPHGEEVEVSRVVDLLDGLLNSLGKGLNEELK